jgi:hypothetical protein
MCCCCTGERCIIVVSCVWRMAYGTLVYEQSVVGGCDGGAAVALVSAVLLLYLVYGVWCVHVLLCTNSQWRVDAMDVLLLHW